MFGFLRKKKPATALDEFIFAVYGNPPPLKRANLQEAIRLASDELLMRSVEESDIRNVAEGLNAGPVPYSTHDLALSVALSFYKRPEFMPILQLGQMSARMKVLEWLKAGLVVPILVKSFEDIVYKLYQPQ
ncbi:MAG TPA: hypothetical protein VGC95_01625 [Chitinophagaceae bacterium]|jgi:hypothetical protein